MKKNKNKNLKRFWPKLWNLLKPSHKQIKTLFVSILFLELVVLTGPFLLKLIIDKIVNFKPEELKTILFFIFLMFISEQFNSFLHHLRDRIIFKLIFDIECYLPTMAQEKLMYLPLTYHEKENTGNKIMKIERGGNKILDLIMNIAWEVGPTFIQLIITLIVLLMVDLRFGLSFAFFAPLFVVLTYRVNKSLAPIRKQRHKDYEISSGQMVQSIININTVKSFTQEKREIKEFKTIRERISANGVKEFSKLLNFGLIRNLIIDMGRITILLLGIYLIVKGNITVGSLVFVITLSEKAYFSLYRLSRFYDRMEEGAEAVNRFTALIHEKSNIINKKNGYKPKKIKGKIEFQNVNFSYGQNNALALDNVSLKINEGCVTAFVGPSGGGKTTLARMIYRHYDPLGGIVLLDNKDLRDYDLFALRKFMSIVPQEVEIFNTSIRKNIAYADPGASRETIEAAARIANAEEFINKFPKKYDTEVGERGIKLSGGQRQRIGIARAILANPKILIFDEATSNLDSCSEKLIQEAMDKITHGRTVIIIAHRLSTIKKADKIIVLENGKIAETGSHCELAQNKGGLYAKLLKLQKVGDVV
ncbi:hypothetical protein A2331_03985 [Candidatus Falkowbacteria bacterium RIFOXYB2_FULL_34_18]|uniref:ABC transporter ATP-binding protein n=1 Tax=Candidatus Falkowbacteria bacterium RIFOXYD2_FULL_34_120 TaxID=1798007 RepID=A0A1F5TPS7_9BACT|nr:MAG: hypothetical protein A2331_03985 [Candidatus Falkowbacteria bacterium RIFOXYB2_FULL_34_18]OGF29111.1 MAG: hypothetical protein A2500_03310 [Candidatus Falkowbacteria bacterium RIFOXYC12_FULL_34_55]OGF36194.1 MAG: hypothetical protein A2466_04840 [Candidatus Falkowbacteria bacterium RIFOXYC2_FULL_34_220]OGF38621.1 MAG: hypothetical protein A2515_02200 [Candidatus Falkowbacteria bacterium RIFOXYD12_FULL_34_57]OGF40804.1 MAG: hypothetical protein A2531_06845 [Candidatus Falkowbacteria bact